VPDPLLKADPSPTPLSSFDKLLRCFLVRVKRLFSETDELNEL